jgi:hypothetical protein
MSAVVTCALAASASLFLSACTSSGPFVTRRGRRPDRRIVCQHLQCVHGHTGQRRLRHDPRSDCSKAAVEGVRLTIVAGSRRFRPPSSSARSAWRRCSAGCCRVATHSTPSGCHLTLAAAPPRHRLLRPAIAASRPPQARGVSDRAARWSRGWRRW